MHTRRFVLCAFVALWGLSSPFSQKALASDTSSNTDTLPYIIMHGSNPKEELANFTITPPKDKKPLPLDIDYIHTSTATYGAGQNNFNTAFQNNENWENAILDKIPHGGRLKYIWNVIDGDVDLHFTGLRADRRNKGVTYQTKNVPFIGEMEEIEFRFDAGEDTAFSFESQALPFGKNIEGLNFKGSVGNNGSRISARYTIPLE